MEKYVQLKIVGLCVFDSQGPRPAINMVVVKSLSVGVIESIRGVPLITILFMASVLMPGFAPEDEYY